MIGFRVAAAAVAVLGWAASHDALSQTPSSSNYRSLAVCEEVLRNGRWYHSFGEGRCPPGSRRPTRSGDVNSQNMERAQSQVDALQAAQRGILEFGNSLGSRFASESEATIARYEYDGSDYDALEPVENYEYFSRTYPNSGRVIIARVGDAVLFERNGFFSECFYSRTARFITYLGNAQHTIASDEISCKLNRSDRAFTPLYKNWGERGAETGNLIIQQDLQMSRDGSYSLCVRQMGMNSACARNLTSPDITLLNAFVGDVSTDSALLTLISINGSDLSFSLSGSIGQQTSNSVITFNRQSGNVLEIGDYSLEVLEIGVDSVVIRRIK